MEHMTSSLPASRSRACLVAASLVLFSSMSLTVACTSGTSTATAVGGDGDGGGGVNGGGNGDGSSPSTLVACAPFAPASITLPTAVGIGKDKNGVLYVAAGSDAMGPVPRVFVMESGQLHEQRILGSGGGSSDFNIDFADAGASSTGRTLLGHVANGKATAMALGTPNTKGFIGDPSEANDEPLTLQDESVLANVTVIGLPLQPEHVASTDDGHLLVVTFSDSDPKPIRVFYGTNGGTLFERTVLEVGAEAQDEGIMFKVDEETYSVNFHYMPLSKSNEGGTTQNVSGELGNSQGSQPLNILPLTTSLAGDTFECFSGP